MEVFTALNHPAARAACRRRTAKSRWSQLVIAELRFADSAAMLFRAECNGLGAAEDLQPAFRMPAALADGFVRPPFLDAADVAK